MTTAGPKLEASPLYLFSLVVHPAAIVVVECLANCFVLVIHLGQP